MNGDRGIDLDQLDVVETIEQARRGMVTIASQTIRNAEPRPFLHVLIEFIEEKINRLVQEGNLLKALRGMNEARHVCINLARLGWTEFDGIIEKINIGFARIAVTSRQRLIQAYLDSTKTPDEVQEIQAGMMELINGGYWPNWKEELDAAVEARRCIR
jgi:hypothetical protein